ncbi:MAG TPA: GNAT family N-acetyltransferase, partial [Mucilaginibacter sp.]|nr:GNAT family N-acetyltransferase [Mucilaginibacter sp.]
LDDIYIRPEARGQGVGKKLLAYLAQLTLERNFGRLEWLVLDWNINSIEFYKKSGAKAIDDSTIFRVAGNDLEKLAQM